MANPTRVPKHSDLIYDVGSHKGEDAEFYLRKGFRVVAFEGDPHLVAFCKRRLQRFVQTGQLKIVEGAVVSSPSLTEGKETIPFYRNCRESVWGTVNSNWAERNARLGASSSVIEVRAIDFMNEIKKYGMPYYMKVDIEGSDMVCLEALGAFDERPSYLSIESTKTTLSNIQHEMNLLDDLGYVAFQAIEQSTIPWIQSPPYPSREGVYVSHHFERGSSGLFGLELEDNWKSKREVLHQYGPILLGYLLLGDDGIMNKLDFPGAGWLRALMQEAISRHTKIPGQGWYDTHARHSSVTDCHRVTHTHLNKLR